MPVFKTFIHGNLPVEIELGNDGDFMSIAVELKHRLAFLDITDNFADILLKENEEKVLECMEEFKRNRFEYDRAISEKLRKD